MKLLDYRLLVFLFFIFIGLSFNQVAAQGSTAVESPAEYSAGHEKGPAIYQLGNKTPKENKEVSGGAGGEKDSKRESKKKKREKRDENNGSKNDGDSNQPERLPEASASVPVEWPLGREKLDSTDLVLLSLNFATFDKHAEEIFGDYQFVYSQEYVTRTAGMYWVCQKESLVRPKYLLMVLETIRFYIMKTETPTWGAFLKVLMDFSELHSSQFAEAGLQRELENVHKLRNKMVDSVELMDCWLDANDFALLVDLPDFEQYTRHFILLLEAEHLGVKFDSSGENEWSQFFIKWLNRQGRMAQSAPCTYNRMIMLAGLLDGNLLETVKKQLALSVTALSRKHVCVDGFDKSELDVVRQETQNQLNDERFDVDNAVALYTYVPEILDYVEKLVPLTGHSMSEIEEGKLPDFICKGRSWVELGVAVLRINECGSDELKRLIKAKKFIAKRPHLVTKKIGELLRKDDVIADIHIEPIAESFSKFPHCVFLFMCQYPGTGGFTLDRAKWEHLKERSFLEKKLREWREAQQPTPTWEHLVHIASGYRESLVNEVVRLENHLNERYIEEPKLPLAGAAVFTPPMSSTPSAPPTELGLYPPQTGSQYAASGGAMGGGYHQQAGPLPVKLSVDTSPYPGQLTSAPSHYTVGYVHPSPQQSYPYGVQAPTHSSEPPPAYPWDEVQSGHHLPSPNNPSSHLNLPHDGYSGLPNALSYAGGGGQLGVPLMHQIPILPRVIHEQLQVDIDGPPEPQMTPVHKSLGGGYTAPAETQPERRRSDQKAKDMASSSSSSMDLVLNEVLSIIKKSAGDAGQAFKEWAGRNPKAAKILAAEMISVVRQNASRECGMNPLDVGSVRSGVPGFLSLRSLGLVNQSDKEGVEDEPTTAGRTELVCDIMERKDPAVQIAMFVSMRANTLNTLEFYQKTPLNKTAFEVVKAINQQFSRKKGAAKPFSAVFKVSFY